MQNSGSTSGGLSPWWKNTVILILVLGFSVLIYLAARVYKDAPPIPEKVVDPMGLIVFTKADVQAGQQVFLKHALMENGTLWGHGAYLGPDFSAAYLHGVVQDGSDELAQKLYRRNWNELSVGEMKTVSAGVGTLLKENRYDTQTGTLRFTDFEASSFQRQIERWAGYFSRPASNGGLPAKYITDPVEIRQLTAFFAWSAWATAANRLGKSHSYTNNFPYEPEIGNTPSGDAVLWSALSLVALFGGLAVVLFVFGRFDYLGWRSKGQHFHPPVVETPAGEGQKATIKYFAVVALLFLAQALVGGATAHYRADPAGFFGFDLSKIFPSHILRTWHLQLAIFWIATAYIAGGLFLASALGKTEPKNQTRGINFLFWALIVVALGSLLGEAFGVSQSLGKLWFWLGHQGWEYLDLGRGWQILLAVGLVIWVVLLFKAVAPARKDPEKRELSSLFLYAALAIPLFYLPAMFFNSTSHYSVVDTWRFWIIHLWVEGFFELFVTVMVAIIFYHLGLVSHLTATRVVYLDAILYLGSGIVGTGHHWYWTGQSSVTMALGAVFSAMEVIPLTLLTLDAWDFVSLTKGKCEICGKQVAVKHKWTFYFLIAVGFWNFVGAGVFGFLINLPIVSYFEIGTILTPNHGHAAMMGVFGMLALALLVFALRQVAKDSEWARVEKLVGYSFWGLNIGLALMVATNLFPGGIVQLVDVFKNGYWHARSPEFVNTGFMNLIEWTRLPADLIFILVGAIPLVIATLRVYKFMKSGVRS